MPRPVSVSPSPTFSCATTLHLTGWKELLRHAIQPVQQFAYTRGKNSTGSALIIDAMDLL